MRTPHSDTRTDWRWIAVSTAVGVLFLLLAFLPQDLWRRHEVVTGTLVSVGTAFLLAAALYFIQRRFITQVGDVATAVIDEIAEESRSLDLRLDELRARMQEDLGMKEQSQLDVVDSMSYPTYFNVAGALAKANGARAIRMFGVVVQGSPTPGQVQTTFQWATDTVATEVGTKLYIDLNTVSSSFPPTIASPAQFMWDVTNRSSR